MLSEEAEYLIREMIKKPKLRNVTIAHRFVWRTYLEQLYKQGTEPINQLSTGNQDLALS